MKTTQNATAHSRNEEIQLPRRIIFGGLDRADLIPENKKLGTSLNRYCAKFFNF
jgi:hypothetical protein